MATRLRRTKKTPRNTPRGCRRIAPLEERAYYTRAEACKIFGFSDKRLAEAIRNDPALPMILNGRNQIFPKVAFQAWYERAASKRVNVHGADNTRAA
jgi:hypothetical protein